MWLNQILKDVVTTRNTRLSSQGRSSTRSTQDSPQERGQNHEHKRYLKRDVFSTNTRTSTREMIPQTQELPQERGLHHKHKSFSKNTRINPRRAPPT